MLKHISYKDITVNSRLGLFYIDKDGFINDISVEMEEFLLSVYGFSKVEEEVKAEVPEVIEVEEVEEEVMPHLEDLSVKQLRAFAKTYGIKLSATKKADIIEEILAEM